ncbi:MAG: threonine/serine exporter family protein [Clostridium sp.]
MNEKLYANDIMHLAARMGKMVLENGGETYRVEQTINIVCRAYGFSNSESFVTPTGIMISITGEEHRTKSLIKRINSRTVNLTKISKVNDLSRRVVYETLSVKEVNSLLDVIDGSKIYSDRTINIFTALGSSCFCLLFGGSIQDSIITFFIGLVMSNAAKILGNLDVNSFFINIVGGIIAASLALTCVKFGLAIQEDKIVIGSIMMLLPGIAITNAIRDTISGDLVSGISRTIEALFSALAIAIGTGSVFNIWFSIFGGV